MKKSRLAPLAALGLALIMPTFAPAQVDDAAEQFFRGYVMKKDAEKMETDGNFTGALQIYQQMGQLFDTVAQSHPEWQPGMLANRRGLTQQAIARVQARLAQPAGAPAPAAGAATTPAQAAAPAPAATGLPIFGGASEAPAPGMISAPTGVLPSLSDVLSQWEQAYRQRMLQLETQNNQMQVDLTKWQQWYQWASSEITTARTERDALAEKSASMEKAVATLKQEVAAGRATNAQLEELEKEKLKVEVEFRKASQRLLAAEQATKEASQKLADASLRVTALEKERNELLVERDTAVKERDTAMKDRDTTTQDRDKISAQILGMQAQVEALKKRSPASDEVKVIVKENDRLKKDLDTAQKQVAELQTDATKKGQEVAELRAEVTTLKQQGSTFKSREAELTAQLKELQDANPETMTPELAKENELLREIVMRQLRSQYRQQQAKDQVLGELQKMDGVSTKLLSQVDELRSSRMTLSPDEEKLFSDPSVREMLGGDSIQGTLIAQAPKPANAAPAPPANPVADLLAKANEAFSAQKFSNAAALYEDALRTDPKNTTALVGLGYSRQRENKLGEAEAALKKCLEVDPANDLAAFHLGVTHFKQQRWNDATAAFEKGLEKNPKNARARHYLGIISTKLNLLDRAEREFKTALTIDPGYGEAHFNLAVLYATWNPPQWDKAKAEYSEALKKGVTPDEALEKLLKGTGKSVSSR